MPGPAGEKDFITGYRALLQGKTMVLITNVEAGLGVADRVVELSE